LCSCQTTFFFFFFFDGSDFFAFGDVGDTGELLLLVLVVIELGETFEDEKVVPGDFGDKVPELEVFCSGRDKGVGFLERELSFEDGIKPGDASVDVVDVGDIDGPGFKSDVAFEPVRICFTKLPNGPRFLAGCC